MKPNSLKQAAIVLLWSLEHNQAGVAEATKALQDEVSKPEAKPEAKPDCALQAAFDDWLKRTEWLQDDAQPGELGMHRADVLHKRILERDSRIAVLTEANENLRKKAGLNGTA